MSLVNLNRFYFFLFCSLIIGSFSLHGQGKSGGNLVIVGGGLESNNKSVFQQLISFAGGIEKATFAVIPTASGVPVQSYTSFRNILISYGVRPENIFLINVAMMDDDSTMDVDESNWINNGEDTRLAERVRSCSAVWFTGGDQLRTMKTLVRPDGKNTRVLEAVWEVYRSGGVLGGTSAGAAIMSEVMIGGGNSVGALSHGVITDYLGDDFPDGDGVLETHGLGFFPLGIVDQHFEVRARIGRLIMALMKEQSRFNLGFGIDENTALIYNDKQHLIQVAGVSGITVVDVKNARISYKREMPEIKNMMLSYIQEGDSFDASTGLVKASAEKQQIPVKEFKEMKEPFEAGIFSNQTVGLRDLLVFLAGSKSRDSYSYLCLTGQNSGYRVTISKTHLTESFITDHKNIGKQITVANMRMDIIPVEISETPVR